MLHTLFALLLLVIISCNLTPAGETAAPTPDDYKRLAAEAEAHLHKHILKLWFPRAVDKERGGFIQDYAEDWTEKRDGKKTLVYQARLTWMAAQVALSFPELAKEYAEYSNHGLDFLADKMWDKEHGGFFWSVTADGKASGERRNEKHVYGISFGLYAASINYKATKNEKAVKLAKDTFDWLEKNANDEKYGYSEALDVTGLPIYASREGSDLIGTRYGFKSMNTHIHMLESVTAYLEANPVANVRHRLRTIYNLVTQKICAGDGTMHQYFLENFTPVPDLDSFGHDIETAYLIVEAAESLNEPTGKVDRPWYTARQLVDHALEFGWDNERGGFYNEGSSFRKVFDKEKVWWVQAEGLNALLLMHEKYGKETDKYWRAFLKQWDFIQKFQVDSKHGGWISVVGEDGHVKPGQIKSDQWKECYHQGRAVINVIERLKKLAGK